MGYLLKHYILKLITFIAFVIFFGGIWVISRDYIPSEYKKNPAVQTINKYIDYTIRTSKSLFSYKTMATLIETINPTDYNEEASQITAQQVALLIKSRFQKKRNTLLFIYDTECFSCEDTFKIFNQVVKEQEDRVPDVLAVGIVSSKPSFVKFLNRAKSGVNFKPLYIDSSESASLAISLSEIGVTYTELPAIAIIRIDGRVTFHHRSTQYNRQDFQNWLFYPR